MGKTLPSKADKYISQCGTSPTTKFALVKVIEESENERQAIMPASRLCQHTSRAQKNITLGFMETSRDRRRREPTLVQNAIPAQWDRSLID